MLKSISNDLMHLLNMIEAISKINMYSKDCVTAEAFYDLNEQLNYNAVLNLLTHIGETTTKISDQLRQMYSKVGWQTIKDLRNRISHDYVGIDVAIIFRIIQNEIPILERQLFQIISEQVGNGSFNRDEYELAKKSSFYKQINFGWVKIVNLKV